MIEGLKPYAEYKESGLSWLGQIPVSWETPRTKTRFRLSIEKSGINHGKELLSVYTHIGVRPRKDLEERGNKASSTNDYWVVRRGDIIVNKLLAWMGAVGVSHFDGVTSPAYDILRPIQRIEPDFYHLLFRTKFYLQLFKSRSRGIMDMRLRLYFDQLGQIPLICPPLDEQTAIVRFLDHANRKIDGFIRAKRKLIGLLNEQKQAIIHRAVTRGLPGVASAKTGLDPNAKLKPSGIPWLGEIPAHWEVRRLRTLTRRIEQGVSPQATGFLAEGDTWGVLKSGCINHGVFRQTEHKQLSKDFAIDPSIVVKVGDVLISRACGSPKLVGSVGKVKALDYQLILSDKTFRVVFAPFVDTDFMVYAMNGVYYRQQVEQAISGADGMANNLPLSELKSFVFAIPPLAEATEIASKLDAELARFTTAIARTEREIALMQEYRTRLTADIVTGKLDVREAAAKLPEQVEEEVTADLEIPEEETELEEGE